MNINIKKTHPDAVIPKYAKSGDAGMDLVAVGKIETELYVEYDLGLAFEIPEGFAGLIFPRSSLSKYHLSLANHVGIVDSGFRGNVTARFKKTLDRPHVNLYNVGDKVCQIMIIPHPKIEFTEVEELSDTERGSGGYGSSGV